MTIGMAGASACYVSVLAAVLPRVYFFLCYFFRIRLSYGENMFEDLIGKNVKVQIGVISAMTDSVKGKIIQIESMWIKLQVKDKVELVNLDKVSRLTILK